MRDRGGIGRSGSDGDAVRVSRLAIDHAIDGDYASGRVDSKSSASAVSERIADRVGPVGVGGKGCETHDCPCRSILQHEVGGCIGVADGRYARFVDVGDIDGKALRIETAIAAGRSRDDVVASGRFVVERAIDCHDTRGGMDGKKSAGAIVERISDRVIGGVGVAGRYGNSHCGADRCIFCDCVASCVAIADGTDVKFIDIADGNAKDSRGRAGVRRSGPDCDAVRVSRLAIDHAIDGDYASGRVDSKSSASAVSERIADRVGPVGVGGKGCETHDCPCRSILQHEVGGCIGVADGRYARFVDVGDIDGKALRIETAIAAGRSRDDVVASGRFVVERAIDCHDTRGGMDGEQATGAIVERIGDRVVGCVGISSCDCNAYGGADGRIFCYGVGGSVAIADGTHVEFIDIVEIDGKHGTRRRSVSRCRPHCNVVRRRHFPIEQTAVQDCYDTRGGMDGKSSACVIEQRVGNGIGSRIGIGRVGRNAHQRSIGGVLIHCITGGVNIRRTTDSEFIDVGKRDIDRLRVDQRAIGGLHNYLIDPIRICVSWILAVSPGDEGQCAS